MNSRTFFLLVLAALFTTGSPSTQAPTKPSTSGQQTTPNQKPILTKAQRDSYDKGIATLRGQQKKLAGMSANARAAEAKTFEQNTQKLYDSLRKDVERATSNQQNQRPGGVNAPPGGTMDCFKTCESTYSKCRGGADGAFERALCNLDALECVKDCIPFIP